VSEDVSTPRPRRWAWPALIAALAVVGALLALADLALNTPWYGPLSRGVVVQPPPLGTPFGGRAPGSNRFERQQSVESLTFRSPFDPRVPVSPLEGLRALLSDGAGLILIALAVLVVFPSRARAAVRRLEDRNGVVIAVAAGFATLLLTLAALLLLRFTLVFLVLIPVLVAAAVAVAVFGIACIALAFGRLIEHRFGLGPTHPLVASLAGTLIVFDMAVIPYVGMLVLAVIAVTGLGVAVLTRFGSDTGWSFADLKW
jgi:hypothetical protein